MRRHVSMGALGLAVALVTAVPVFAIVNGSVDSNNVYSNVCGLVTTKQPTGFPPVNLPQSFSSGTLVHPKVVLTAGHTVGSMVGWMNNNGLALSDYAAIFTPDVHDPAAKRYRVKELRIHPGFSGRHGESSIDVGVLILTEAVTGVPIVKLPDKGFLDALGLVGGPTEVSDKFTVVGHGTTVVPNTTFRFPPGIRRSATSSYQALRNRHLLLSQNFSLGEGGVSSGDSGGPAFWRKSDGSLVQAGLLTAGDHASVSTAVFVRTDVESVMTFIQKAISDAGSN